MDYVSKSDYLYYLQCPKYFWISKHKTNLIPDPTDSEKKHIDDGMVVGKLAHQYFPGTIDGAVHNKDGSLKVEAMLKRTKDLMARGIETIAEAAFLEDGLFCSVDLLHLIKKGIYAIYEVKSSTKIEDEFYDDIAFQHYVLTKAGVKVAEDSLLLLNKTYCRQGDLDYQKLFHKTNILGLPSYALSLRRVEPTIEEMRKLNKAKQEPSLPLDKPCKNCSLFPYCTKDGPHPNVFDVNKLRNPYQKWNSGIRSFEDLIVNNISLNYRQQGQIDCHLGNKDLYLDTKGIKAFLSKLTYPLYHLDFETMNEPIPLFDGAHPYDQIPFQYSLHIQMSPCGKLVHKEFLGRSLDCRREIAESLCRDIPLNVTSLAYFFVFEKGRLKELANLFPDLHDHLMNIHDHMVDLYEPFKSGVYYSKAMGGSNSIKAVLPALWPNEPSLDYHALPVVHNGGEAMAIYPTLCSSSPEDAERIRKGLLMYCGLDTMAMVKVLQRLYEAVEEDKTK